MTLPAATYRQRTTGAYARARRPLAPSREIRMRLDVLRAEVARAQDEAGGPRVGVWAATMFDIDDDAIWKGR